MSPTTTCPAALQQLNGLNTPAAIAATIVLVAALAFVAFLIWVLLK